MLGLIVENVKISETQTIWHVICPFHGIGDGIS